LRQLREKFKTGAPERVLETNTAQHSVGFLIPTLVGTNTVLVSRFQHWLETNTVLVGVGFQIPTLVGTEHQPNTNTVLVSRFQHPYLR
jgi:hypothetical protein